MKRSKIHVTDHALIRHMERVMGLDVEAVRLQIGRDVDRVLAKGAPLTDEVLAEGVLLAGFRYCLTTQTTTGRRVVSTVLEPHQTAAFDRYRGRGRDEDE